MSKVYIGIDPGVNTGFAVARNRKLEVVESMAIHRAMVEVYELSKKEPVKVFIEDARKRKWFGDNAHQKQQGAGSVKRDCKIWEDFLTDMKIDFEMIPPGKGNTKRSDEDFKSLTGWQKKTNEHARDAGMIVFGR